MNSIPSLFLAVISGVLLGGIFFGGLWWTVRKALASANPALWFLGSTLIRMGCAVAGFYFVSGGDWRRLLACFAGFLLARVVVTRITRNEGDRHAS